MQTVNRSMMAIQNMGYAVSSLFTRPGVLDCFRVIHMQGDIAADIKNEMQKLMTQSETLPEDRDNLHAKISERAGTERRKKRKGKEETNEIDIA
ncbi:hypothetical protein BTUL_0060g00010 [Botrytis tulipae]|uniref:Uncharacterized protein n=1 Tax=Botrytis tulipae TaxID=87230 RepID=A0A4Z1ENP5_9HELO|nr:hypothetical protein BTUL_0060g00010 [Botrytis tulipae]